MELRPEYHTLAKVIIESLKIHNQNHGPESDYYLDPKKLDLLEDIHVEALEEVHKTSQLLELQIESDALLKSSSSKGHTLEEKRLVVQLRRAVQKHIVDIFANLARYTTPLPNTLFLGLDDATRAFVVQQTIRRRLVSYGFGLDENEWVSCPCGCVRRYHEDVKNTDLIQVTDQFYNHYWYTTSGKCQGRQIMLEVVEQTTNRATIPWWLPMLQGMTKIPKWASVLGDAPRSPGIVERALEWRGLEVLSLGKFRVK